MTGEITLWNYLRNGMRGRWHAQRHEDRLTSGIPDVSFAINGIDGWLELKAHTRAGKSVNIGISNEQAVWLHRRGTNGGGRCFVLVRVGKEHLLFRYTVTNLLTCSQSMDVLRAMAEARWIGSIDFDQLIKYLTT